MNKFLVILRIFFVQTAAFLLLSMSLKASIVRDTLQNDIESPENIRLFADYLFGQKDFLRAVSEYSKLSEFKNDTVHLRIASALGEMGRYGEAETLLNNLLNNSNIKNLALPELLKNRWLLQDYKGIRSLCDTVKLNPAIVKKSCSPLYYASYLADSLPLPGVEDFTKAFPVHSRDFMRQMYERKKENRYKTPLKAALLSALIPGAGKIYAGQTSDGITAFIVTGILGYLAWDNFRSDHGFRAWAFTGLGTLFYAGNIYGSAAQAQIFNAGINYNFHKDLNNFIQEKNYFNPAHVP